MKKVFISVITIAVIICSVVSCSTRKENKEYIKIGVAYYDKSDTFIGELIDCFIGDIEKEIIGGKEVIISLRDASGSQRTQNGQIDELINEGCDILCVNLVDRADPSAIMDSANKNNLPIIFFNREPVAEDLMQSQRFYYVGADAKQSGELQGELISEYIDEHAEMDRNNDGMIQYVILEGEPGHQDAIIRTEAVVDTLTRKGIELEKLSYAIANWSRAQAQNRMTQLMSEYSDEIELVISNNDDMAIGAIEAYSDKDYMPPIFGIDGTDVGLESVEEGKLAATVYNDKEGQAKTMAKLSIALITGEGINQFDYSKERVLYLPYYKITSDNIDDYLK